MSEYDDTLAFLDRAIEADDGDRAWYERERAAVIRARAMRDHPTALGQAREVGWELAACDPLAPAKGVLLALLIGAALSVGITLALWWIFSGGGR